MIKTFHRFRSIKYLLGDKYNELENQEIYFASLEKLKDPMEGFKDIYWHGDEIIWKNFIKHYLLCLEHVCSLFIIGDKITNIDRKDIPIFKTEDNLPTPQYKQLFKEILDNFFGNDSISQCPKNFSSRLKPIRRNELLLYIRLLHQYALDVIFTVYENNNFIGKRSDDNKIAQKALLDIEAFLKITNKEQTKHQDAIEMLYAAANHTFTQINLIVRYNIPNNENKDFVFLDFPEMYLHAIEKLIYPDWYTACFMSEYSNSSSVWAHYGDGHQGVCLSFKALSENDKFFIALRGINGLSNSGPTYGNIKHLFYKINYENKFVEIDFFKSLGCLTRPVLSKFWYTDEAGSRSICADAVFDSEERWRNKHWSNFYKGATTKLKDWEREKEYRLILSSSLQDFSDPTKRKLNYDFNDLESITFGIETPMKDKKKIIKIIKTKCRKGNRADFKFYQAYYDSQKGSIERAELGLLKFE
jgi:hypothetical protein